MIHIYKKEICGGKYKHTIEEVSFDIPEKDLVSLHNEHNSVIRSAYKTELLKGGMDSDLAELEANKVCVYFHHKSYEKIKHFKAEEGTVCGENITVFDRLTTDPAKVSCGFCRKKLKI